VVVHVIKRSEPRRSGVCDDVAAVRTTRYNDTGAPTHHKISSIKPDLSTRPAVLNDLHTTCAKDVCMISVHT